MSVKATERAWESTASGNDLLVLLALADHAGGQDDPYDHAYPSVERLENMTRLSRRTVQRCLRSLAEAGHIRQTGEHVWGRGKVTIRYRIEGGRQIDAASPEDRGGVTDDAGGASPVTPKPSIGTVPNRPKRGTAREQTPDAFPDDLPPELEAVAIEAGRILKSTALTRGQSRPVTRATVGHAVLTYPDRDHVQVAREVQGWLLHGRGASRPCADVVARFRNFLQNADPRPAPPLAGNVHPMRGRGHGGRPSVAEIMSA